MPSSKIPKIIHQVWLQTEKYIPDTFREYSLKTQAMNGDFKYMFWDESKILDLIKDNEAYMNTYYSFLYMHQKIDFARYIILYTYGGIFIDMDAYTIKQLSALYKLVDDYDVVVSLVRADLLESLIICQKIKCINNGNILCKPNAGFMKFIIQKIIASPPCGVFTSKISCIKKTTGPIFINRMLDEYKGSSKIKVLDPEYIEPCRFDECDLTQNSYIIHVHAQTWVNEPLKKLVTFYLRYKAFMPFIMMILFIARVIASM